jgi:uncharacterized protein (DUF2336 family)
MAAQKPARAQELIELASHDVRKDRGKLYMRISELFQMQSAEDSGTERGLLIEIMRALSAQVDQRLRLALAERLADHSDADHDLILLLAHDEIEVARPVILRSVILTEADLIGIIRECSPSHSLTLAGRINISPNVTSALIETERRDVFRAMTRNATAQISPACLERLVEISRDDPSLAGELIGRPQLPKGLALRMFSWASAGLKTHIAERFAIDPATLEAELARSVSTELARPNGAQPRARMLESLVEKLRANGQLRPGFLIKAVREGQMDIFRIAFARLLDIDQATLDLIFDSRDIIKIALATRAVGIDRSAFPTIVEKLCGKAALDNLTPERRKEINEALSVVPGSLAREQLLSA